MSNEKAFPMPTNRSHLDLNETGYCGSFNFRRTARAVTRMYDVALQESGVRSTQFAILVAIAKKQPVSIGVLADVLVIDRTTLTRSLRLLEKEGLISISGRSTMRQRFLSLTLEGERVLARSLPAWRKAHAQFLEMLGAPYWKDLRKELERIARVVSGTEVPFKSASSASGSALPASPS
jgi:DNA-binding MarR family transcriptional regulator